MATNKDFYFAPTQEEPERLRQFLPNPDGSYKLVPEEDEDKWAIRVAQRMFRPRRRRS